MAKLTPHQEIVKAAVLAAHASRRCDGLTELSADLISAYMPRVPHRRLSGVMVSAPAPSPATLHAVAAALGWETHLATWTAHGKSEPFGRGYHTTRQCCALSLVRPATTAA